MLTKKFLIALFLFTTSALWAGVNGDLRQGGKFYKQEKYGQALSAYQHALSQDPTNSEAALGAGASAYYLKDYALAEKSFGQAADDAHNPRRNDALFNLGNTYYRAGQTQQAAQAYRSAILQNPQDKEAIHNLQLLLQQEQNQQNQDNQNQQNENKDSSNQDNQDQNNQGQSPQDKDKQGSEQQNQQGQQEQNNIHQDDADRVLQIARDNEFKQNPTKNGRSGAEEEVEKDW